MDSNNFVIIDVEGQNYQKLDDKKDLDDKKVANKKESAKKVAAKKVVNKEIVASKKVDDKKFPLVKLLKQLPTQSSLYETVIITINDYFVFKFLEKKIDFKKLISLILKFSKIKEFQKYKKIKPKNIGEIYRLRDYVSSKMDSLGI